MLPPTFHICRADACGDVSSAAVSTRTWPGEEERVHGGEKNRCDYERGINNAVWLNWGRGRSGVAVLVVGTA